MGRVVRLRASAAAAAVLLMLSASSSEAQRAGPPDHGFEVGEPFPHLSFPTLEGEDRTSLADFRGQKVILHVFASW